MDVEAKRLNKLSFHDVTCVCKFSIKMRNAYFFLKKRNKLCIKTCQNVKLFFMRNLKYRGYFYGYNDVTHTSVYLLIG